MAEPGLDRDALLDAVAYVERWLAFRQQYRDMPGVVVGVRHREDVVLLKAFGLAQLSPPVPMTTRHMFRIASHSKTFTATAVMQLVERERLRLDDRAATYIRWLDSEVTIRQLLSHAGGVIRDGVDADFWRVERPFPDESELRGLAAETAILPTNAQFKYSNIGFALLGLVVEHVAGMPYNQYVREHIVDRLGLVDTGPELDPTLGERLVTGYTGNVLGVPRRAVPPIDTRALSPATGFYSSAEDLLRYGAAHWFGNDVLLSDASKREMQHPAWSIEHSEDRYGLGLGVERIGKRQLVGHGGGFPGQSTRTLIDPVDQLVVVVLGNTSATDGLAAPLATQVVRTIDFAQARAREAGAPSDLERFTGRFANVGGVIDVVRFGTSLFALSPEMENPLATPTELEVSGEDRLRIGKTGGYGAAAESVRYERDAHGAIERVVAGGVTHYPEERFRQRYADGPHWHSTAP
jgi:CubicO group peptidase (beta-lactamase class C family)